MTKRTERRIVIGVSAYIGGGKDYVADILVSKYGFYKVSPGDITRDILRKAGTNITRDEQEKLTKRYIDKYGQDYVMALCYKKLLSSKRARIVIPGIRYPSDIRFYKEKLDGNFVNIFVSAPRKLRYERMLSRKREDTPKSYSEFMKQDASQQKRYDLKTTKKLSDHRINNNVNNSRGLIKKLEEILAELN